MGEKQSDLTRLPGGQLSLLAQQHLDAFFRELRGVGGELQKRLRPLSIARRHPWMALAVGGMLSLAAMRLLRKRISRAAASAPSTGKPAGGVAGKGEGVARTFGRSLLSGAARTAGRALPGMLLWGISRRGQGGRQRGRE